MRRLRFTPAAQADLLRIYDYIATACGYPARAERFVDALLARCGELAARPGTLGMPRAELLPDLRCLPHGNYIIFFRYLVDCLEIVSILEGHRDITAYFKPPE